MLPFSSVLLQFAKLLCSLLSLDHLLLGTLFHSTPHHFQLFLSSSGLQIGYSRTYSLKTHCLVIWESFKLKGNSHYGEQSGGSFKN